MAKSFRFGATVVGGMLLTAVSLDASPMRNSGVRVRAPRTNVHVTVNQPTSERLTALPDPAATSSGLVVDPGPVTATAVATAIASPVITLPESSNSGLPNSGQTPDLGGGTAGAGNSVPEPGSVMIWVVGLMGVIGFRMSLKRRTTLLAATVSGQSIARSAIR